ncbi:hypothetical protein CEPID_04525 [Corynebacterium epidermidicanis]|uniref:DUF6542 domain-containing protein n=2 Tax=Corynebacterium epidermidicanis TaxID=1050174 RepID=A0A0G3GNI1_9CORY|nr:hypothetical protein CEPID_04525 [Corynebacterium epidermidicanis]
MLLSWNAHEISWPYWVCFVVAALSMTIVVELRGLFLTVAQLPLLFGVFTIVTGWLVAQSNISASADSLSKTMLLSALYPLAQYFPQLAATTAGCAVIAYLRYRHGVYQAKVQQQAFIAQRQEQSRADQRNRATTTIVREMSERTRRNRSAERRKTVTVEELVRNAEEKKRMRTARGRSVPPRREPGESVRNMPSIEEVTRKRESSRRPDASRDSALGKSTMPAPQPKRRPSLDDDLYQ